MTFNIVATHLFFPRWEIVIFLWRWSAWTASLQCLRSLTVTVISLCWLYRREAALLSEMWWWWFPVHLVTVACDCAQNLSSLAECTRIHSVSCGMTFGRLVFILYVVQNRSEEKNKYWNYRIIDQIKEYVQNRRKDHLFLIKHLHTELHLVWHGDLPVCKLTLRTG